MPEELINILLQLPIVAVFIWYSERMSTNFQAFLREERSAREKQNDRFITQLEDLAGILRAHDSKLDKLAVEIRKGKE